MAQYTLTYSPSSGGWPSFYSFIPEWITGSNSYLYTFNKGQMWRHNASITRSNFYGTQYASSIQTILHASPIEQKVFKTIELVGTPDIAWNVYVETNLMKGYTAEWYTPTFLNSSSNTKEGHMYSYLYGPNPNSAELSFTNFANVIGAGNNLGSQMNRQRSINAFGVYQVSEVENLGGNIYRINFPVGAMSNIGQTNNGVFAMYPDGTTLGWNVGYVTNVGMNDDSASLYFGRPCVTIDGTGGFIAPNTGAIPATRALVYIPSGQHESYGVLGDYAQVNLSINTGDPVEMFSLNSEVMKSFP